MKIKKPDRAFTIMFLILILFLVWNGCSKKTTYSPTAPDAEGFSVTSSSSGVHSHSIKILFADLTNPPAAGVTYTSSSSGHTHTIHLSQLQLTSINTGSTVTVISTVNSGHSHDWVITKP